MRYVDTYRFSPVAEGLDLPHNEDYYHLRPEQITKKFLLSEQYYIDSEWWEKQFDRCMNGYTVENATDTGKDIWIPGRYYFYLNFWHIRGISKKTKRKEIIIPRFYDVHYEKFFLVIERMIKEEKNNQWQKSRQKGFSEMGACDIGYEYTFFTGSQSVIVAGEEKYTENMMNMVTNGLDLLRNTQFYKERADDRADYISSETTRSQIFSLTAKVNAQVVSGKSPSLIYFEEVGIWKKGFVKKAYGYVEPSLQAEGIVTGRACFVGTGGEADEGVVDAEEMFYNPDSFRCLKFPNIYEKEPSEVEVACFVPAYYFEVVDKDGNSLIDESIEKLNKERESKKAKERFQAIVTKPMYASESFAAPSGGFFGEAITQWCNERKAFIYTHKEAQIVKRGTLTWNDRRDWTKGCVWEFNDEGDFQIAEHPELYQGKIIPGMYITGTDSYDQDVAKNSDSQGATWIKKSFSKKGTFVSQYVAGYVGRPTEEEGGAEAFYEKSALLCAYYGAMNLIEYSKVRIMDWYKAHGFEGMLMERPTFVSAALIDDSKATNRYGIDPSTKIHWLKYLSDWLADKTHIDECYFVDLLNAWAKYRYDSTGKKYNCDITIATSLCHVGTREMEYIMEDLISSREPVRFKKYQYDDSGNIVAKYV